MKVKELKEQFVSKYNTIEVYTPTDEINCTSIKENHRLYKYSTKENHRLYKYSTNSDDKELDFYTIEPETNTLMIFTQ